MKNQQAWDAEYKKSKLVTKGTEPQKDFLRFLKWIKKSKTLDLYGNISILDLGCGIGRNAAHMSETYGANAIGWDFSKAAIAFGKDLFKNSAIELSVRNIGESFPLKDTSIDIVLDITASNALNEPERETYLKETHRVLTHDGLLYVRTLAKEADSNAKDLLKQFPGPEYDTYTHPELEVTERVFSREDFEDLYSPYFKIKEMTRKTGYQKFGNQRYKRNYWNVYMVKKSRK